MDAIELAQCERFKQIRKSLKMKQSDFAKELAVSQGHASDIENGRKTVSDRLIEIISLKFNVNSEWLKTGTGSMHREVSASSLAYNHFGYMMSNSSPQKKAVLTALVEMAYSVPDDKWNYILSRFNDCLNEAEKEKREN